MRAPTETAATPEQILNELRPELLKLLASRPSFGTIGVELTFHADAVAKIAVRAEVLRKPRGAA